MRNEGIVAELNFNCNTILHEIGLAIGHDRFQTGAFNRRFLFFLLEPMNVGA